MISVAMITNSLSINGISTVVYNYCKYLNKDNFNVVVFAGSPIDKEYREAFKTSKIQYVELPNKKQQSLLYYKKLLKELKKRKFDIAHVHGNSSSMGLELLMAQISGVRTRIAHSHNSMCEFKAQKLLYPLFKSVCTDGFACGKKAGEWLFGNHFSVLLNGFDIERFRFSAKTREEFRKKLGVTNNFVVGHIGALNYQKNHSYLLDVFEKIADLRDDAMLVIVGEGSKREEIQIRINNSKHKDKYILYGNTPMPEKMYMAMDVMVFPSRYEGFPVTLIEAQISGLNCVISDMITEEIKVTNLIKSLPLNAAPDMWADYICNMTLNHDRVSWFDENFNIFKEFDINSCVRSLEDKYVNLYQRDSKTKR